MRKTNLIGLVAMLVISGSGMAVTTQLPGFPSPPASRQTQAGETYPASERKTTPERKDGGQEEDKADAKQEANEQEN